jgi:hypothetical protein
LDRADNVKEFVMRDKDSGFVEVELQAEPGKPNHVIRRELEKASNKCVVHA